MTDFQIYEELTAVLRKVLRLHDLVVSPDQKSGDIPGWDSFKTIEIAMAIERRFDIEITSRELDTLETVGDFFDVIKGRQPGIAGSSLANG